MSYLGKRKSGGAPLLSGKKRLVYRAPSKMAAMSSRYNRYAKGLNRRGVMSKESGFVDLAAATYACNSTGSITLIATVAQGTSVNQRVGKKIQWKSMQIRGTVQANPTTVSNNSAWLIVYDRRPTGFLPAITDVLSSATAISFTNDANSGRFQILKRWNDTILGNGHGRSADGQVKRRRRRVPLAALPALRLQGCWHRRDRRHRTRRPLPDHGGRQRGWQYRLGRDPRVPHAFPGRVIQLN